MEVDYSRKKGDVNNYETPGPATTRNNTTRGTARLSNMNTL